ncbi:adenine phosphoribosyltransferase 1-like isoform X3 [Musa acuminata AAA Group]|uniref:adenine phosphoribosyltransferase 1-like isoform X3 n=1 Tax=Musa acuminata AAA Group TaxID=214697 RepID=UPI0031CFB17A
MMASEGGEDYRLTRIASAIRVIPDFPKPGIMFQDITTLLLDPKAFRDTIDMFVERYRDQEITVIAGVEARGFIFGPPIALAIGAKFVPMRKPKKLPGKVISEEYSLEYGTDRMEMHVGAVQPGDRALVIDDLIATGGTLSAAIRLPGSDGIMNVYCIHKLDQPSNGSGFVELDLTDMGFELDRVGQNGLCRVGILRNNLLYFICKKKKQKDSIRLKLTIKETYAQQDQSMG